MLASRDKAYQLKDLTGEMFRYFLVFSRGEQETHPEPYDAQILCAQLLGECAAELRSRGFDVNLLLLTTPCTVITSDLLTARRSHIIGDTVTLTILRDGQQFDVEVTLRSMVL